MYLLYIFKYFIIVFPMISINHYWFDDKRIVNNILNMIKEQIYN